MKKVAIGCGILFLLLIVVLVGIVVLGYAIVQNPKFQAALNPGGNQLVGVLQLGDVEVRPSSPTPDDAVDAGDLTAAHVRALARAGERVKLVVTGAGRELLEEVHWGLTPEEQRRVFWDFAWIWGPTEDHFAHLLRSVGAERFVYGTHWPLRLAQNPRANLDLLPEDLRATVISDARSLER